MILFIGAGVSTLFGIEDTKGFIKTFDDRSSIGDSYIYNDIKTFFKDDFDLEILMTLLDDLAKDTNNLISSMSPQTANFIINNIEKQNYIDDIELKMDVKHLLRQVKNIIRRECIDGEFNKRDTIMDVYDRFFNTLTKLPAGLYQTNISKSGDNEINYFNNLKIVTTNYDRCIETFLSEHQINFFDGVLYKFGHLIYDVDSFEDVGNRVGLFKLHGSIDLYNIQGKIRRKVYEEEIGYEVIYYPVEFSGYMNIIESPYLELFYLFRNRLNISKLWIIIGSSLRDRTICSIMNDVIRLKIESERPKIILVNPNKKIIDRLKNWGFTYLSETIVQLKKYFGPDETNIEILNLLTKSNGVLTA